MDKEIILSVIGLVTAIAALVRWLISVYWSQASTIEDLRHQHEKRHLITLKETITDLKKDINMHKQAMVAMQEKVEYIYRRLDKSAGDADVVLKGLSTSIDDLLNKINLMETQVISLAKGMVMIKSKVDGSGR